LLQVNTASDGPLEGTLCDRRVTAALGWPIVDLFSVDSPPACCRQSRVGTMTMTTAATRTARPACVQAVGIEMYFNAVSALRTLCTTIIINDNPNTAGQLPATKTASQAAGFPTPSVCAMLLYRAEDDQQASNSNQAARSISISVVLLLVPFR
jgi:hypothetical protein